MSNSTKRKALGWSTVAAIVLFFILSMMGTSSGQMMIATALFAHLPVFIVPFYAVLGAQELGSRIIMRGILRGWAGFLASAILWEICYHSLYRRFHWGVPDLPGEFLAGLLFGWFPAGIITAIAVIVRLVVGRAFPYSHEHTTA